MLSEAKHPCNCWRRQIAQVLRFAQDDNFLKDDNGWEMMPLAVVVQERKNVISIELLAAFEEVEFHDEAQAGDLRTERLRHFGCGLRGAAGGEQVVDNDHALALLDR